MNLKVYIKTFSRNICDFLLLITNRSKAWDNAHLHAWFRVLKIEIIDNNDEKHGRMIESNRWKLCKLWCTFSFAGNLVLKIRVDSSAQHIWGVPSNELLTRGSHRNDDNYNFCICVTFLLIIRFILIFISAIRSHLSFHPPVQRHSVTDTLFYPSPHGSSGSSTQTHPLNKKLASLFLIYSSNRLWLTLLTASCLFWFHS